jgi:hypothetical protein
MARPRKSIEELRLAGSPNAARSLKREMEEASVTFTPEQQSEIAQLDKLIAQAMKACAHGITFRGKRNPASAILADLVKTRERIEKRTVPVNESKASIQEATDFLNRIGKAN